MPQLTLRYDRDHIQSVSGSAWVMMGDHELTQDCGSISELESAIDRLQDDLETVRKQGRAKFAATRKAQMEASAYANRT